MKNEKVRFRNGWQNAGLSESSAVGQPRAGMQTGRPDSRREEWTRTGPWAQLPAGEEQETIDRTGR